jgi:iron complex outermembrane receptor protein
VIKFVVPLLVFSVLLQSSPLLAQSQDERQRSRVIEEVIVTANKRSESIQDVSSAVTALSGDVIERSNIVSFFDLADVTPGMVQQSESNVSIRGIGRTDGSDAFASAVAIHENGFFLPNATGWPLLDLEAVEITRGPAGTVFGRNATGGTINSKWRKPNSEFGFNLDATVGSYSEQRLRGVVNIPLLDDDRLNSRWAFVSHQRDGYTDNAYTDGSGDGGSKDEWLWRGYLSSQPSDNLRLGLRYMHWFRDSQYVYGRPDEETRTSGIYEDLGGERPPQRADRLNANVDQTNGGRPGWDRTQRLDFDATWSLIDLPLLGPLDVDFLIGKNISEGRQIVDLDGSEVDIVKLNGEKERYTKNAELRFSSQNDSGFEWMFGLFWTEFFIEDHPTTITAVVPISQETVTGTPLPFVPSVKLSARAEISSEARTRLTESYAAFSNFSADLGQLFDIESDIRLFGGYRINFDYDEIDKIELRDIYIPENNPVAFSNAREENAGDISFREPTWEMGVKWFINDDHMIYLKSAKGYKAGAIQTADNQLNVVAPEILNAIELGAKNTFLEGALRINSALYSYDYTDLQVLIREPDLTRTENAASASLWGLETEVLWQVDENWFTSLALAYSETGFGEYCTTDPAFPQHRTDAACEGKRGEQDLSGKDLPNAPPLSASALLSYSHYMSGYGSLEPSVRVTYTDDYYSFATNHPRYQIESYTKTDIHMVWRSASERWTIDAYVQHLEDKKDIFLLPVGLGLEGYLFQTMQVAPRTYGLNFKYSFDD